MRSPIVVVLSLVLDACASQGVHIRTLPPQTPAADNAAAADKIATLSAAAPDAQVESSAPPVTPADAPPMQTYDPWERLNRFTYRFNAHFDNAVFLPVADSYRRLPSPLRSGVHNFFDNLAEVANTLNFGLQGRVGFGVKSVGRFLINSTIGIGGLFDVAAKFDLPYAQTGFGTTLAKWGMHPGPYLVLPLIGPSTLRDGIGLAGDFGTSYVINLAGFPRSSKSWMFTTLSSIDMRANIDFRYYETGSAFEYEMIRFLYVRKRLIEDEGLHKDEPELPRDTTKPAGQ